MLARLVKILAFVLPVSSLVVPSPALGITDISAIRLGIHEDKTRLVVELNHEAQFQILKSNSDRSFQIKLPNSRIPKTYTSKQKGKGYIAGYYASNAPQKAVILHIDAKVPSQILKAYPMTRASDGLYRLVIDIAPVKTAPKKKTEATTRTSLTTIPMPFVKPQRRVVVIDAGHGGQDPGSTSPSGYLEKDITLAVALEMKNLIDKSGKYTAVLTRSKDQHLPLRYRFSVAREMNANLLISLHADNNPNKNVKGVSVYTLSEKASDMEAQRLADKENAADFLEDLKFTHDGEADVKDILINLSQTRAKNHSIEFADLLMKRFDKQDVLLKNSHRSAGFAVLKAPDVASVLIELGYLSNVKDEKRLVSKPYQRRIASLIVKAIDDYFEHIKT